jgi:hypothetical protein
MKQICNVSLLFAFSLLFAAIGSTAQSSPSGNGGQIPTPGPQFDSDDFSQNAITFELVRTLVTLADEEFLTGELSKAQDHYKRASVEIGKVVPEVPAVPEALLSLLHAEIDYRTLLLSNQMGFWGYGPTGIFVTNPAVHLKDLEDFSQKLSALNDKIDGLIHPTAATQLEDRTAVEQKIDSDIDIDAMTAEKQGAIVEYHQKRMDDLKDRAQHLQEREQFYAQQAQSADSELTTLENANTKLFLSAVGGALSLPVDPASLQGGDLKQNLLNIGSSMLSDSDSPVSTALKGLSKQADDAIQAYQKFESIRNQAQQFQDDLKKVQGLIREPTVQNLLSVGSSVYSQLPADQRTALINEVSQSKPLFALVGQFGSSTEIRGAIVTFIAGQQDFGSQLPDLVKKIVNANQAGLNGWYYGQISTLINVVQDDSGKAQVMVAAIKSSPAYFTGKLSVEAKQALQTACSSTNDASLIACVGSTSWNGNLISVNGGAILVAGHSTGLDVTTFLNGVQTVTVDEARAEAALLQLVQTRSDCLRKLLEQTPARLTDDILSRYLPAGTDVEANRKALFDRIMNNVASTDAPKIWERLAQVQAGSVTATQLLTSKPSVNLGSRADQKQIADYVQQHPNGAPPSGASDFLQSGVAGALGTACPTAGVAIKMATMLSNFYAMDSKIKQINEARGQIEKLVTEEVHVYDLIDESTLNLTIAQYDQKIALLSQQAARSQLSLYRDMVQSTIATLNDNRANAMLYSELFFYYAERLREEYDALDWSLALWAGAESGTRGKIAQLIRSDPNNLRFAMDSQIHLFDWLNRDVEEQREDLQALTVHWLEITALADNICDQLACRSAATQPQFELQRTSIIRISQLLTTEDRQALKDWQAKRSNTPIDLWFLIHPASNLIPSQHENARIVDLQIGGLTQSQGGTLQPVTLSRFELTHPGISYIALGGKIFRDTQAPRSSTSAQAPHTLDLSLLKSRWTSSIPVAYDSRFEGYGPFTLWHLRLDPDETNYATTDIGLQITYQYFTETSVPHSPYVTAQLDAIFKGVSVTLPSELISTLGNSNEEIALRLQKWRTTSGNGVPVLPFDPKLAK